MGDAAAAHDLRSAAGPSTPCTHSFRNNRDRGALIFWLDYEGRAVQYGTLEAGKSLEQATFSGHAWRLVDEASGAPLAEYVGASATITLQADGSVKVVVPEPAAVAPAAEAAPAAAAEAAVDALQ